MSATSETTQAYSVQHRVGGLALTEINVALGAGAVGVFAALAGMVAFLMRVKLAVLVLGAHFWFETPMTDADAMKVLLMTIQALELIGWGVVTAATACAFALFKWTSQPRTQP